MGIVPQDFGLLPNKKVWENVGYAMRAVGKSRTDVRQEVPDILERVNILHRADAYPTELSGGRAAASRDCPSPYQRSPAPPRRRADRES
jgi:ABC-type ATPase involved in cell division